MLRVRDRKFSILCSLFFPIIHTHVFSDCRYFMLLDTERCVLFDLHERDRVHREEFFGKEMKRTQYYFIGGIDTPPTADQISSKICASLWNAMYSIIKFHEILPVRRDGTCRLFFLCHNVGVGGRLLTKRFFYYYSIRIRTMRDEKRRSQLFNFLTMFSVFTYISYLNRIFIFHFISTLRCFIIFLALPHCSALRHRTSLFGFIIPKKKIQSSSPAIHKTLA